MARNVATNGDAAGWTARATFRGKWLREMWPTRAKIDRSVLRPGQGGLVTNVLKSRVDAQSFLIRGEDVAGLEALIAEYVERFLPASAMIGD